MAFARLRFMVFVLIVLGLPAALMSTADTELVELGRALPSPAWRCHPTAGIVHPAPTGAGCSMQEP